MNENLAVVLGMFETGLSVGRNLGRFGVRVIGLDISKKIGFYSKYINASICPHPLEQEGEFISYLVSLAEKQNSPPVLFITSDEFLLPISRNRKKLEQYYLMNLPDLKLLECITDKMRQTQLAQKAGIPVPLTYIFSDMEQLTAVLNQIPFPVFIKGREVTSWRKKMGVTSKGFIARNEQELINVFKLVFGQEERALVQEIIPGPDRNHFKVSCYVSRNGDVRLAFGLQKIRQQPIGFGFGCLVQSIKYPELLDLGISLFTKMGYRGVGSAEFKLDQRDGKLKLIELNPRYWQQNSLAERCGMNFPLIDYLELTGQEVKPVSDYRFGIKWLNMYADFDSFREYRGRGQLTTVQWLRSLKGEKVFSDISWDDLLPGMRELFVENLILRSARYIARGLLDRLGESRRESPPCRGKKDIH